MPSAVKDLSKFGRFSKLVELHVHNKKTQEDLLMGGGLVKDTTRNIDIDTNSR